MSKTLPPDEPAPAPPRNTPGRWTVSRPSGTWVLGAGLLGLESMLLAGFFRTEDWAASLASHLGLVAVIALPGLGTRGPFRPARLQLAVWTALLGPFGVLVGLMLFLPRSGAPAEAAGPSAPAGRHAGGDGPDTLRERLADGRLRLAGGHAVRPLLDVMIEGIAAEKLEALGLVAKRYEPGLAPTLRRALQDADGSVRVLAATVMAKLRDGQTRRIGLLQDAVEAAAAGSAESRAAWRALGEARMDYAASLLLEPDRAAEQAAEGRACLARGAEAAPEQSAPDQSLLPQETSARTTPSAGDAMAGCLAG